MTEFNTFENQACLQRCQFVILSLSSRKGVILLRPEHFETYGFHIFCITSRKFRQTGFHMTSPILAYGSTFVTAFTEKNDRKQQ